MVLVLLVLWNDAVCLDWAFVFVETMSGDAALSGAIAEGAKKPVAALDIKYMHKAMDVNGLGGFSHPACSSVPSL